MNVYLGGAAKLAAALAQDGAFPSWLAGDAYRSVPRRPLFAISVVVFAGLAALAAGVSSTEDLVRATSALFIAVYVLALLSAIRILSGKIRLAAGFALAATLVLAVFSAGFLIVPVVAAAVSLMLWRLQPRRRAQVA